MSFPNLRIGDLVAKVPIIQGGMGIGVSLSGLASAVANQGGVGVIATAGMGVLCPDRETDYIEASIKVLREEIRKAKEATKGILGVNIMVALTNFADMVETSIAEGVDVILAGAGLPLDLPKYLKGGIQTKLVPIISSAKAARIICKRWLSRYNKLPDAFVVEGPMAGGHLGFSPEQLDDPGYALEKIIPEVVEAVSVFEREHGVKIPVIAAGGIYTGADILEFMKLGAAGVQMGTRFVATHECDANIRFKKAFIDSQEGRPGNHTKSRRASRQGHKKRFHRELPGRAEKAVQMHLSLHHYVQLYGQPLLYSHGPEQRREGETQERVRFCGKKRLPGEPDILGQGTHRIAGKGIRQGLKRL